MSKAKLILIAAFAVTLIAGGAAGYAIRASAHHRRITASTGHTDPARPPREHFPDLNLSPEQEAKIREIWSALRDSSHYREDRQALRKQTEDAVRAILTEEQKPKYEALLKEHADKVAELGKASDKAFQEAVEKTKLILNAEQRTKYEEWLKSIREERRPGGPPPEPGRMGGPPPGLKGLPSPPPPPHRD